MGWVISDFCYWLPPIIIVGFSCLVLLYGIRYKEWKAITIGILIVISIIVYAYCIPTRFPFEDHWIIGKTREEIIERYARQENAFRSMHLLKSEYNDRIIYRMNDYFNYSVLHWYDYEVDVPYNYEIIFDENGFATKIHYYPLVW